MTTNGNSNEKKKNSSNYCNITNIVCYNYNKKDIIQKKFQIF